MASLDPVGGTQSIFELDVLVALMCCAAFLHAILHHNMILVLVAAVVGYWVEFMSIRFGGTHCHAEGSLNFSECSSFNSVFYYVPYIYCGITAGRRLMDENSLSFPFICGLLFFGIYECQGPMMRWWIWPGPDRVVLPDSSLQQYGEIGQDSRGVVVSQHASVPLSFRVYEIPVMALYFHIAFGWGIATAFQIVGFGGSQLKHLLVIVLGPALAMLWDLPVRLFTSVFGASPYAATISVVLVCIFIAFLLGEPKKDLGTGHKDWLLFASPLISTLYFLHNALVGRGSSIFPSDLKVFMVSVAMVTITAYARATSLFTTRAKPAKSKSKKN